MRDKILDFIEDHRILVLGGIVVIILLVVVFAIRGSNAKKKAELAIQESVAASKALEDDMQNMSLEQDETEEVKPTSAYLSQLGLDKDPTEDERIEVTEPVETDPPTTAAPKKPSFPVTVSIFDNTAVPAKNVDGSSCKAYLNSVKLVDFGTFWGTALTEEDFSTSTRHLVGVEQDPQDFNKGDLQSVGWLIQQLPNLNPSDCVKFTNLHVIGALSSDHVALLCSYDWYSAFGLKDTLVVFEDISGTLQASDFKDGDIFSATVFVHNIKTVKVQNQTVVVVQYNVFD